MATLPITEDEIQQPRTPGELLDWCCGKIEEIAATEGGTTAVRLGKGLCKQLVEEVYPLAIWAVNSESVSASALMSPCIGSQHFDAIVKDEALDPSEYYVEITQAHMGQSEHFRLLHLNNEGWAPGPLSAMRRVGQRGSGQIQPGRVLHSMAGQISQTVELIREAISRKIAKEYPQPIVLVVGFEDFIIKNDEDSGDILCVAAKTLLEAATHAFRDVFLVGMSGHLILKVNCES